MPARLRAPPQQDHREGSALRFARADIDLPAVPGHDFLDGVQTKAHAAPRHVHLSTRPLHRFEQPTARLGRNRDTRVVHTQLYLVDPNRWFALAPRYCLGCTQGRSRPDSSEPGQDDLGPTGLILQEVHWNALVHAATGSTQNFESRGAAGKTSHTV